MSALHLSSPAFSLWDRYRNVPEIFLSYFGESPEPRPGLPSGHIPNSLPLPFTAYLNPATDAQPYTSYKSPEDIKVALVDAAGGADAWKEIQDGKGVVFSCGSGMTAAVGWLGNELLKEKGEGAVKTSIYDEVRDAVFSQLSSHSLLLHSTLRRNGNCADGAELDGVCE